MLFLYNISIFFYSILIRFSSPFNEKAKLFILGRTKLFERLNNEIFSDSDNIWIHCASLGEFEQARPLIEEIKKNTNYKVLLTFFSPSGYEIRKNYKLADWVYYMPLDTKSNAKKFIKTTNPKKVFFTKYEFWFHFLNECKNHNIETYLFSAKFRENQVFFKWYGSFFRKILSSFNHFFVQDVQSQKLLKSINFENTTVNGDTRFDRVIKNSKDTQKYPEIEKFKGDNPLFIIGSAWKNDLEILTPVLNNNSIKLKVLIAPHEINNKEIEYYTSSFNANTELYSKWDKENTDFDILILDTIGMLSSVYQYGDFSYIGGGFGKGIHNTLEAAVFGNPIIFGPNFSKFGEAVSLVNLGGATCISNAEEFKIILQKLLTNIKEMNNKSDICKSYVFQNEGATSKIMKHVFK